ncbi:hypothetical protein APHAL10511_001589 [Amanita phalloides]|nr:hypothetical protein APHAL10511_001589 [Amanita phalloides]
MLAPIRETSRPRPPAKARRSTSNSKRLRPSASSPPPSYTAYFDENVGRGLPHSTTEDGLASPVTRAGRADDMDSNDPWGLRGDDEQHYHENEDGVPASLNGEASVFERDVTALLVSDGLLSGSPPQDTSPLPIMPPLFNTPSRHYYTYSHSTPERLSDLSASGRPYLQRGHLQRMSMSAADVAYLADQNAELLEKLEKLEQESSHSDQSGRRQLKRLEKEIAELREELEKTQAKSEELEEKTKHGWNSEQVVNAVARKKLEREAKMKALRNLGHDDEIAEDAGVKSFAPDGSMFGGPSSGYSFMTPSRRSNSSVVFPKVDDIDTQSVSSPFPSNLISPRQELPVSAIEPDSAERPEIVLINKLMDKMSELQDANARIIEQQTETTKQLQAFQQETEQMNRLYQSLGSSFEVEDAADSDYDRAESTRFYSFSQVLGNHQPRSASAKRIARHRRRTLGSTDTKAAKAAVRCANSNASRLNLPIPFPPSPNLNRPHSFASLHDAFVSPALSSLSLDSAVDDQRQSLVVLPTLQSELGDALSVESGDGNNFHLRSMSIFNLSAKPPSNISIPPSPSPSPGHLQAYHDAYNEADEIQGPPTPMSLAPREDSLLLHPEAAINEIPPTPATYNRPTLEFTSPGLQSPRYYRMSQTVRSRTDRWVKGRFSNSLIGTIDDIEEPQPLPPTAMGMTQQLAQAFETVVEGFTNAPEIAVACEDQSSSTTSSRRSSVYEDATHSPLQQSSKTNVVSSKPGFSKVILELWLWLQFVVIILVFLWAMARRGPKAVLFEGNVVDGKRALSARR